MLSWSRLWRYYHSGDNLVNIRELAELIERQQFNTFYNDSNIMEFVEKIDEEIICTAKSKNTNYIKITHPPKKEDLIHFLRYTYAPMEVSIVERESFGETYEELTISW